MISLDKKLFKGDFKQRLGNDMSLSGGDMRVQNSAEKEELKAITKPRWISKEQGSAIKSAIKQKLENEQKNGKLRQINHELKQRGMVGDIVGKFADKGVDKLFDWIGIDNPLD